MKNANKLVRKVASCVLAISLLSGLCVTAGLLTTSAAAAPGDKVVDLSKATSSNVEIGGELKGGAVVAKSDFFSPDNGIYLSGKSQTVQAGTQILAASFPEETFGKLGDKILDKQNWTISGDGFKFSAFVPTAGNMTTVGMHVQAVNDEGKSSDYFMEYEVTPGQKQDLKFHYEDFKRLSVEKDFEIHDKDGNRNVNRPNPGDTTVENAKYLSLSRYSRDQISYASVYVRTNTEAQATVTPKLLVSDISIFDDTIQAGYITKWNDYDVRTDFAGIAGIGGNIPCESSKTDIFAPNGGIYVYGDRTLHADATDKVNGEEGIQYDVGPKNVQIHWQGFQGDLSQYQGLSFQLKQTESHNIGRQGGQMHIGVKLWYRDPVTKKPDSGCYIFQKFMGIDTIDTVQTIKMKFSAFAEDSADGEKMPMEVLKDVTNIVIYSLAEFYQDTVITSDMYISDLYGFQKTTDPLPTPQNEEVTTYPPQADPEDPNNGTDPGPSETTTTTATETTTTTTTEGGTPAETTTTTAETTTTTTITTTKPTTTTIKPTTATTTTTVSPVPSETDPTDVTDPTDIDPTDDTQPDTSAPDVTNPAPTDAPSNDNPNTGAATPIGLAVLTGVSGMAIFFTKKKRK